MLDTKTKIRLLRDYFYELDILYNALETFGEKENRKQVLFDMALVSQWLNSLEDTQPIYPTFASTQRAIKELVSVYQ